MSESAVDTHPSNTDAVAIKPRSAFSMLAAHAARSGGEEAILTGHRVVTHGELAERVGACAAELLRGGLVPGRITAISLSDEIEHLTVSLALIALNTPQINLGSQETDSVKLALFQKLDVTQIVAERSEAWMHGATVLRPDVNARGAPPPSLAQEIPLDTILLYCPTSGSTNVPKTFGLTFERLLLIAKRQAERASERRVLRTSSIEFHSTRLHRICALLAGNTCVFCRDIDLRSIGEVCASARVTEFQIGTYKLVSLLRADAQNIKRLPSFTQVMSGGSRVPGNVRRAAKERLTDNLWVSYATSEIGPISMAAPQEHDAYPEGVGLPMPGVTVRVVDDDGNEVAPGEIGQGMIQKPGMPRGYFADAAASSSFRDGWFYPRDLLSRPSGGPLVYHGRVDDMMILNSINIFPSAIEDVLESHPDVSEAVAYARASRVHGEIPVAAVVLKDGTRREASHLLDHCREILGIRAPRQVIVIDRIPRNAAGKPLRRELARS